MKLRNLLMFFFLTVSPVSLQANGSMTIKDLDLFLQPLQMTKAGLFSFFDNLYNSKRYVEDFFPDNFTHLKQFLNHGKQTSQNEEYTTATIGLFSKKLKECVYVSAYEFDNFLVELPYLAEHHCKTQTPNTTQKKEAIKELLYQELLNNYDRLKEDPLTSLDALSSAILSKIDGSKTETTCLIVRNTIVRFLEIGLGKLLWDATDAQLWAHIKQCANHLALIHERGMMSNTDLDELYWSLLLRFSYFIDIVGTSLPLEFYQAIQADIRQGTHPLFALEEQEELAQSRKAFLERAIFDAVAVKHANQLGIVTQPVPVKN